MNQNARLMATRLEPCAALAKSLERDAEYTMRKGLLYTKSGMRV